MSEERIRFVRSPYAIEKLFEMRLRRFNLTRAQYDALLKEQCGRCAVCEEPLTGEWVIDHCHLTLRVRGLLHSKCNSLLGFANEDPRRLELAIAYLKKHNPLL